MTFIIEGATEKVSVSRQDTQHNDIQHNDTERNNKKMRHST